MLFVIAWFKVVLSVIDLQGFKAYRFWHVRLVLDDA